MKPQPHPASTVGHFLEGGGFPTVNHLRKVVPGTGDKSLGLW